MPYLDLDGERIYYALHHNRSDGVPIVFLHGAGENHLVWPIGLRRLTGTIGYAIDLPGHGKSSGRGYTSLESYADQIMSFMSALELQRAILIGHSMGGAIAQLCGLLHPDRISGLVLIATGAKLRVAPQLLQLIDADFPAAVELIADWEWGSSTPDGVRQLGRQQLLAIDPQQLWCDFSACDVFDVRERLAHIAAPTLIIAGEADHMTPVKQAIFLAEHLPHASLRTIPNAGHMVMIEAADVVTQAVADFIKTID